MALLRILSRTRLTVPQLQMNASIFQLVSLLALTAACFASGCVPSDVSDLDHDPYADNSFEEEGLEQFFGGRSALLLSSKQIDVKSSQSSVTDQSSDSVTVNVAVKFKNLEDSNYGTAAVIDSRGYFVTAAHCVEEQEIYAFYPDSKNNFAPQKIRIVWKGNPSRKDFDFAIFHVKAPPARIFHWSDSFENGEAVFSAGNTLNQQKEGTTGPMFNLDSFKGELEGSDARIFKGIAYQRISHRSPIPKRNSGGPLVNGKGKLIGINYSGAYSFKSSSESETPVSKAIRPDLKWLKAIIEKDYASISY